MEEELLEELHEEVKEETTYDKLKAIILSLENIDEKEFKIDLSKINTFFDILSNSDTIRKVVKIEKLDDLFLDAFKAWDIYKASSKDSKLLKNTLKNLISNISIDYYKENLNNTSNEDGKNDK